MVHMLQTLEEQNKEPKGIRQITNETGAFYVDGSGRLVHYEDTLPNDMYGARNIFANDMQGSRSFFSLIIPEGVAEIPDHAFRGYEINHGVTLPASLKQVGKYAFSGGHIDKVVLPEHPDHEMMCQLAYALRFVHTWDSKKLVQDWPQEYSEIYHGKGETRESWRQVQNISGTFFIDSDGVLMDYVPNMFNSPNWLNAVPNESGDTGLNTLHIPEGVVAIPCEMFKGCRVQQKITFPKSLRCIGVGSGEGNAFSWAALPDVVFPENLVTLGNYAFAHGHLRSVTITGISEYWNVGIRRAFMDSTVGMIRVPVKYREVLDEACRGWGWSEGFEMTDPVLGQLYCVQCLDDKLRWGETVLGVLGGIAQIG